MEINLQAYDERRREILDRLSRIPGRVDSIRLYLKNIEAVKRFSCATWTSRQDVIAAVSSGENTGFAECILSVNCPEASLTSISFCGIMWSLGAWSAGRWTAS